MLQETEKAYAAGIIDGEGTIGIWREARGKNSSGYRYRVALEVSNTKELLIDWLVEKFGGYKAKSNASKDNQQLLWKWRCTTSRVPDVVNELIPYLLIKVEQAKLTAEFCAIAKKYNQGVGRRQNGQALAEFEKLWEMGKTLNKRGVSDEIQAQPNNQ